MSQVGALFILFFLLAGCSSGAPNLRVQSVASDLKAAPDFVLPKVTGGWHSLKDFRGRTVILHFWSPWCVTCGPELQSLQILHSRYKDQLAVLAVSVGASFDDVRKFALLNHLSLPIVVEGEKPSVSQAYNVELLPVSFIVDSKGELVAIKDYQTNLTSQRIEGVRYWTTPALVSELLSVE